jgi:hypothetical protein
MKQKGGGRLHYEVWSDWRDRYIVLSEGLITWYVSYDEDIDQPIQKKGSMVSECMLFLPDGIVLLVHFTPSYSFNWIGFQ